jgi:hypothetical protein
MVPQSLLYPLRIREPVPRLCGNRSDAVEAPADIHFWGMRLMFRTGVLLLHLLVGIVGLSILMTAEARPKSPNGFCAAAAPGQADCPATQPAPAPAPGMKWHPGHYLKTQGNHGQADQTKYLDQVASQLPKTTDSDLIQGALVSYAWGAVEPTLGKYDWSPIYKHLNYLSAHGKRLIIDVEYKCFWSDCSKLAPVELEPNGSCSPIPCEDGKVWASGRATIVEVWDKSVMDHFLAMWQALAAEFDANPYVELVTTAESAPSLKSTNPPGYSTSVLAAQLQRLYTLWSSSFETTTCMALINALGNEVAGLVEDAYQAGCGQGGPDLGDTDGNIVFRGEDSGGNVATRDYRKLIPHFEIVSSSTLTGGFGTAVDTPAEVIAWGRANRVTHYAWVSSLSGEDSWANVLAAIKAVDLSDQMSCPTAYEQGCNTQ